jgi:hypothetical protein
LSSLEGSTSLLFCQFIRVFREEATD